MAGLLGDTLSWTLELPNGDAQAPCVHCTGQKATAEVLTFVDYVSHTWCWAASSETGLWLFSSCGQRPARRPRWRRQPDNGESSGHSRSTLLFRPHAHLVPLALLPTLPASPRFRDDQDYHHHHHGDDIKFADETDREGWGRTRSLLLETRGPPRPNPNHSPRRRRQQQQQPP